MATRASILGRRHREQQQQQQQPRATTARINNDEDATVEPQPNRSATKHDTAEEEECASSEKDIYVDKPILRGKFHQNGTIVYPPFFGVPLYLRARPTVATPMQTTNIASTTLVFSYAIKSIMIVSWMLHTYPLAYTYTILVSGYSKIRFCYHLSGDCPPFIRQWENYY